MKSISIIIPEGAILGSIEGPRMIFTAVNDFFKSRNLPPMFKVQLVGLSKTVPVYNGMYTVITDQQLAEVTQTDLIVIPAFDGNMEQVLQRNQAFIPWLTQHYKQGAEVASLCMGAFLLASTGLLTGRKCATHWMAANAFRKMFPDVCLVEDKIITDEQGIYSSGGAFSYLNLVLYLIEKYAGRETAIFCSKIFLIDIQRDSQSPFIIFQAQKEHEDEQVKNAQEFIEKHFQDKISVDQLADMLSVGRRSLERRFKKATSNTVTEYIQRVKMEAAKKSFETSRKNVNEIMYDVGYADIKAFRTTFRKITGLSPVEYRNKYKKTAVA